MKLPLETEETETVVNFKKDVAYASGFHSENASAEFCNFDVDSMLSESSSNVDEDDSESEREDEGTRGDDINKFVCDAILRAVEMKDQMSCSVQNFDDLLHWGKELYLKNNVTDNATTMWPSIWEKVCNLLENIGYSNPKLYWICLDSSHPCLYAVLENKEDCCPHCGKHGSIPYYYLSVTNKVKRWCSSSSMCKKMTAHMITGCYLIKRKDGTLA